MKINLFLNFYVDSHILRQQEIDSCLIANFKLIEIDNIIIVVDYVNIIHLTNLIQKSGLTIEQKLKLKIKLDNNRPTYNDFFKCTRDFNDDINIISNSDIIMDDWSLKILKNFEWKDYCLALSRWDYIDSNLKSSKHHVRRDSQDVWIKKGGFRDIPLSNFNLGMKGCDNRIAYLLSQFYKVINPSKNIKTFHLHLTNIRNYAPQGQSKDLILPPYLLIEPTKLMI